MTDTERLRLIAHNPRTPGNTRGALLDAAQEIERLRALIEAHNAGCVAECEARRAATTNYRCGFAGNERCDGCPRDDMIDMDAAQGEGKKEGAGC